MPGPAQFLREPREWVEAARFVGVTLHKQLSWVAYINHLGIKAALRLGVLVPSLAEEAALP